MPKQAKLTLEILKPLVAAGLKPKQIAHETGSALRMVHRQLKTFDLRKPKVADMPTRTPEMTQFHKSSDPILSRQFELDAGQFSAANTIRMACSDNIGVKGFNLERAMMSSSGGQPAGGMTDDDCAAAARMQMKQWLAECRNHIDPATKQPVDHRPALLIAGHGIPVKAAGRELGISERRASKVCKHTLDIYARMMGWQRNDRPGGMPT